MSLENMLMLSVVAVKRQGAIVSLLAAVSLVTALALVGMHPSLEWVSVREGMFLASVNLLAMSGYFRWLSPNRDSVSPVVTSGVALLAAALAMFSSKAVTTHGFAHTLEMIGVSGILLLTVILWFWYDILVLNSFPEKVNDLSEAASFSEDDGNE